MSGGEGGEEVGAEEIVAPAPGANDLLAGLSSGLVLIAYFIGGPAAAARSVAVAALPAALLPLVNKWCRRYAVYFYSAALCAVFAGLFCCALEPLFLATAAAVVASFAWTLARHARGARTAQGLQSPRR